MGYDIIVIGGGPAGLSAAARAAWLSLPAANFRAQILLLESSDQLGGLALWQPLVINTPGVFFTKRELKALIRTCEHFGVTTRFETVVSLCQNVDRRFSVTTDSGRYTALSAIVACGCRRSHAGEPQLFHRKRVLWYHSIENLEHIIGQLQADAGIEDLCLCGARGVVATHEYLGRRRGLRIRTWAEPPAADIDGPDVDVGWLQRIAIGDTPRLSLSFERADGSVETFETDVLLVDFNAYQARATSARFLEFAVRRLDDGFLDPDRRMATDVDGLFSAGDINGAPFSVAKAISDGTIAGFSAYAHVHRQRMGEEPNLFPYYPFSI